MLDSILNVSDSSPTRQSRTGLVALWGLQAALAVLFLLAGGSKLAGAPDMVALFDAIGVGHWFRVVTGLIEVGAAIALLTPALAPFGALLLASTMAGAVITHLFIVGGSPAMPVALLIGLLAVVYGRRQPLRAATSRLHAKVNVHGDLS